jgi:hypothetical protein
MERNHLLITGIILVAACLSVFLMEDSLDQGYLHSMLPAVYVCAALSAFTLAGIHWYLNRNFR